MSEWGVVGVLSALAGLFFVVYTPLARRAQERSDERYELERQRTSSTKENTEAVTRLTTTIELMAHSFEKFEEDNADSHRRIWDNNREQDDKLACHETRITVLEREKEKKI